MLQEGFNSCLRQRGVVGFQKLGLSVWVVKVFPSSRRGGSGVKGPNLPPCLWRITRTGGIPQQELTYGEPDTESGESR